MLMVVIMRPLTDLFLGPRDSCRAALVTRRTGHGRLIRRAGDRLASPGPGPGRRLAAAARPRAQAVTIPLAPRTARGAGLAIGEPREGPVFLAPGGGRLDRHGAGRIVRRVAGRAGITKPVGHTRYGARSSPRLWTQVCAVAGRARSASDAGPRTTKSTRSGWRQPGPARHLTLWPPTSRAPPGSLRQLTAVPPGGRRQAVSRNDPAPAAVTRRSQAPGRYQRVLR